MGKLNEITDENFKTEVLENSKPYVVTYSALSYCQPCIQLHKILKNEVLALKQTDFWTNFLNF